MSDLLIIPVLILSGLLPVAGLLLGKRLSGEESDEHMTEIREESRILEHKIIDVLAGEGDIASKGQLSGLRRKALEYRSAAEAQKKTRVELEQRLTTSHADVIARESAHQDMKAEKQDDEVALQSVLSNYSDISSESVSLERRLADSLKTIDKMTNEISMSEDQKAVFDALANALTNASAQLRDVIIAHQNVYERLEALRSQYTDLEGEYIKLVELQLES